MTGRTIDAAECLPDRRREPGRPGRGARGRHAGARRRAAGRIAARGRLREARARRRREADARRQPRAGGVVSSRCWSPPTTSARPAPRSWRSASRAGRAAPAGRYAEGAGGRDRRERAARRRSAGRPSEVRVGPVVRRELDAEQDRRRRAPPCGAGRAASARSRRTRDTPPRDPGDHAPPGTTICAAARAQQRPRRQQRAALGLERHALRAMSHDPAGPADGDQHAATPRRSRPRPRPARAPALAAAAAIHSGNERERRELDPARAVRERTGRAAQQSASRDERAGHDVVRPARRGDHHGREGQPASQAPPGAVAAACAGTAAPERIAAASANAVATHRAPSRLSKPSRTGAIERRRDVQRR